MLAGKVQLREHSVANEDNTFHLHVPAKSLAELQDNTLSYFPLAKGGRTRIFMFFCFTCNVIGCWLAHFLLKQHWHTVI